MSDRKSIPAGASVGMTNRIHGDEELPVQVCFGQAESLAKRTLAVDKAFWFALILASLPSRAITELPLTVNATGLTEIENCAIALWEGDSRALGLWTLEIEAGRRDHPVPETYSALVAHESL
jgi:hypothetical protein